MNIQKYRKQVSLLLKILPILSTESSLALHGGTAINLFHRNMPRLSVDIDLTYLPITDRDSSVTDINRTLNNVKLQIERVFPQLYVVLKSKSSKLFISSSDATIKLEVNLIKRGCFAESKIMSLCSEAQMQYSSYCEIKIVEMGHLYGGKICAALDRQHPRDLFDIHMLFESEGMESGTFNVISGEKSYGAFEDEIAAKYGRKIRSIPLWMVRIAAKIGDWIPGFPLNSYRLKKLLGE